MSTKTAPKIKKPDDKQKLLATAIKKTIKVNTALPILECVYFDGKSAIVSDLETSVVVPYPTDINVCVPAKKVIDITEIVPNPKFEADKNYGVQIEDGKRKIKVMGDNPDNFPLVSMYNTDSEEHQVGRLSKEGMQLLEEALCFVSKDELRPAMTGVYFEEKRGKKSMMVATDAHRMFFHEIDPLLRSFILPPKTAKILLALGGEWNIASDGEDYISFTREDGLKVVTRIIDGRFPDFRVVIPTDEPNVKLFADPSFLLKELKNAGKFANKSTNMVTFSINGVCTISSQEVDFGEEYISELSSAEIGFNPNYHPGYLYEGEPVTIKEDLGAVVKIIKPSDCSTISIPKDALTKAPMEFLIGFNTIFLQEIVHKINAVTEPVEFHFWSSTKATVINGKYLVMPLMLNS